MKVVIIEPLGVKDTFLLEAAKTRLEGVAEIEYFNTRTTDTDELIKRGKDADIIVVSNLPLPKKVLEGCKNLKLISVAFTGIDHIAMDYCRKNGIMVCNCSGYSNHAVSELVFGSLLCLMRNIIKCDERSREEGTKDGLIGNELYGKTFGVIGAGAIGSQVALVANAFGCKVWVTKHNKDINLPFAELKTLEEIMSGCDVISLHTPLNDSTKGLIGEKEIALMKSNAILVNMARGPVVDSAALAKALNDEKIAGAVIDVFETEPPVSKDHVLVNAKNTVLTPHVAFATKEALELRAEMVFDNVVEFMKGTPVNVM